MSDNKISSVYTTDAEGSSFNIQPETIARSTKSALSSKKSKLTPKDYILSGSLKPIQNTEDPEDEVAIKARRIALARSMPKLSSTTFDDFLDMLGLYNKYANFIAKHALLFDRLSKIAPRVEKKVYVDKKDGTGRHDPKYKKAIRGLTRDEERLVACFKSMLVAMDYEAHSSNAPTRIYTHEDYQNSAVSGSNLKPDLAFFNKRDATRHFDTIHMVVEAKSIPYPDKLKDEDLGQIAEYAQYLWKFQLTRKFVSVLFLHGQSLSIFAFFRNKTIRVNIGDVFIKEESPNISCFEGIRETLMNLHFLLTLSPKEFGHICDFTQRPPSLYFPSHLSINNTRIGESAISGNQEKSVLAEVRTTKSNGSDCLRLGKMIKREVRLSGRIAYIVNGKFNNNDAVLKLSWTLNGRLPENAIYDVLNDKGIKRIPKMFSRGLLFEDFEGYRLEYMVMEKCGMTLFEALNNLYSKNPELIPKAVLLIVRQVIACLVDAFSEGIMHRDISNGNIAVTIKNGRKGVNVDARVIDWGYSKNAYWKSSESKKIAQKWKYSYKKVGENEEEHDPFIGAPRYMSISTLLGISKRNAIMDIESLFYVVLDALQRIYSSKSPSRKEPTCFHFFKELKLLGHIRASCMAREDGWLSDFGINKENISPELLKILNAMRKFLFFDNGNYIGNRLTHMPPYTYIIDETSANVFMDVKTIKLLMAQSLRNEDEQTEVDYDDSPTKRVITKRSRTFDMQPTPSKQQKRKATSHLELQKQQLQTESSLQQNKQITRSHTKDINKLDKQII